MLLVEDEDAVRALGRHVLRMCGYTVLEAGNGREAVRAAEEHAGPLAPRRNRRGDARRDGRPAGGRGGPRPAPRGAGCLFTSGYTDDAVVRHGVLEADVPFLQKPFTPASLAQKVRDVLDRKG